MAYTFPLAEVNALIDGLKAAGVRATIDPAKVNTPGVWLNLGDLDHDTLACSTLRAEAVCCVADTTDEAALANLAAMHDAVLALVDCAGLIRFQGTVLPGPDLTPLPSLVVPVVITN